MDASHFDRLTRLFTSGGSRRTAFAGLLSGLLAPITLGGNPLAGKRRRKKRHKKRRRRCVPEPVPETCARAGCGAAQENNCGQAVACPCPADRTCLLNGTCAQPCTKSSECTGCQESCSNITTENQQHCLLENYPGICDNLQACSSTAECPRGMHCQECPYMSGEYGCLEVCPD
jgi:hypothetical protein